MPVLDRPAMPSLLAENAHYLLIAILGIWFALRFILAPGSKGPGGKRSGLAAMFRRERPVETGGLGQGAISTLLADSKAFAQARPDLRGLVLAGPFAAGTARPDSPVTLVFLAEDPARYALPTALEGWGYPARGHAVLGYDVRTEPWGARHELRLRGAPPLILAFVVAQGAACPSDLADAAGQALRIIEDPAGQARVLHEAWLETRG